MAVKVMVAPAIAKAKAAPKPERAPVAAEKKKPKHRRSAVFDAEGNEVFITLMCLKCHKMRPLSQFGLRKMADGAIRNQPWCRSCRSGTAEKPSKDKVEIEPAIEAIEPEPQSEAAPEKSTRTRSVAAEVAAALAAGWKR